MQGFLDADFAGLKNGFAGCPDLPYSITLAILALLSLVVANCDFSRVTPHPLHETSPPEIMAPYRLAHRSPSRAVIEE
jgi:hypothetical protein